MKMRSASYAASFQWLKKVPPNNWQEACSSSDHASAGGGPRCTPEAPVKSIPSASRAAAPSGASEA